MIKGGLDRLRVLMKLQDDAIERFWASHRGPESTWQGNRGYVALGIALSKPQPDVPSALSFSASPGGKWLTGDQGPRDREGDPGKGEFLLKSQIRRSIELERALAEKEKVIRELDQALRSSRDERFKSPLQFLSRMRRRLATTRGDASRKVRWIFRRASAWMQRKTSIWRGEEGENIWRQKALVASQARGHTTRSETPLKESQDEERLDICRPA